MSKPALLKKLEKRQLKTDIGTFSVGDTVRVHTRIIEKDKERIQIFMGTVIARRGTGLSETFSIHRIAYGVGMERIFLLHSPRIAKIEVVKEGRVRRGKLYYLRGTSGKAAKVEQRVGASRNKKREKAAALAKEAVAKEEEKKAEPNATPVQEVLKTAPTSETAAPAPTE